MKKAISIVAGILLGALLTEAGLRVYFHESEATGTYWGKGAFVADKLLGYRHAPSSIAWCAREGSFEAYPVRTNARGFRDRREFDRINPEATRIVVGGASFTFGLGVENDDELFHVRLERRLRDSGRFPNGVEVYNLSQTGYHIDQVCDIVRDELDELHPDVVLIGINQYDKFLAPSTRKSPEFSAGYRLAPDRVLPGRPVDFLRTHSFTAMRCGNSPMLAPPAYYRDQLALRGWAEARPLLAKAGIVGADTRVARAGKGAGAEVLEIPQSLRDLKAELNGRGIALACMVIYRPGDSDGLLGRLLRSEGYRVIDVRSRPDWVMSGDGRWNSQGHLGAAAVVFEEISSDEVLPRARDAGGTIP